MGLPLKPIADYLTKRGIDAAAASERAQAQSLLASFFDHMLDSSRLLAVEDSTSPVPVPPLEALLEIAEGARGELVALRHEIEAEAFALPA